MAVRTLWMYLVGRARTLIKNYNVLERADKVMESDGKLVPPRHPGTEAKFKVLVKESNLKLDMEKKPDELLDRLKTVKVTSDDVQNEEKESKPLPKERISFELPLYGYEEPKTIPEGKCTLKQALKFITNHQNDPSTYSGAAIAEEHKMKASDVEHIIENFRVYEIYVSKDKNIGLTKSALKSLGVNKVTQPLYHHKFEKEQIKQTGGRETFEEEQIKKIEEMNKLIRKKKNLDDF